MLEIDKSLPKAERILLAAEDVFSRKGYVQSTLDEIIKLADTGKGTVYKYFQSKDNLFYVLIKRKNEGFVAALQKIILTEGTIHQKLAAYLETMIIFFTANSTLWQILFYERTGGSRGWHMVKDEEGKPNIVVSWGAQPSEEEAEQTQRYFEIIFSSISLLEQLLDEGVAQGIIKGDRKMSIPAGNLYGGLAMTMFHGKEEQEEDPCALAQLITDRFLYGHAKV
ncbi:MAG: TetR/AcrR family transcriptional regulator [Acidaminococcaceae bacterium]